LQVRDGQRRHGLRRLQAARRDRRMARLENAAGRNTPVVAGRRDRRHFADRLCAARPRCTDSVRTLSGAGRPDRAVLGRPVAAVLPANAVAAMAAVIALTGGIGSGKTSVANLFAERGATVIDTDEIAHALTAAGEPGARAIAAEFGTEFLDASGALDRKRMRELVFSDAAAQRTDGRCGTGNNGQPGKPSGALAAGRRRGAQRRRLRGAAHSSRDAASEISCVFPARVGRRHRGNRAKELLRSLFFLRYVEQ